MTVILSAIGVIALDQACKSLVVQYLADGESQPVMGSLGVVMVRSVRNDRCNPLAIAEPRARWLFIVTTLYVSLLLAFASPLSGETVAGLGLSMGGAASNLADRMWRGTVIDFIALGRWSTFNIADVALVAGVALVAWSVV